MIIPRREHLASTAISAAQTLTPDFYEIPAGTRCITFFVTYEGDAADSQLDLDIDWASSLTGTEIARDLVIQGGLDVTQPEGRYNVVQTVRRGPLPGAGATIIYEIAMQLPAGARRVRMRPTGVGDDGTVEIGLTGGSQDCGGAGRTVVDGDAVPSGTTPAPSGFLIARREHLASQTLPGAGAFTNQAFETVPAGTKRVAFWVTYTRGAAGGFPKFHVEFDNGTDQGRDVIIDSLSLTTTDPNGQFNVPLAEPAGAVPADGSAIEYVLDFDLPPNTTGVRLLAAEEGVAGTPGTIAIGFTGEG